MISYTILKTKILGDLLLTANEQQLIGIYFVKSKQEPSKRDWKLDPKHAVLKKASKELQEYFEGKRKKFSVPLYYIGTDFQKKVWREIAQIPFGKTVSYSDLASRAGSPNAVRAAGTATGKNPLGIIIPCHRVLAKN